MNGTLKLQHLGAESDQTFLTFQNLPRNLVPWFLTYHKSAKLHIRMFSDKICSSFCFILKFNAKHLFLFSFIFLTEFKSPLIQLYSSLNWHFLSHFLEYLLQHCAYFSAV